jgi:segregation and condensation protein B
MENLGSERDDRMAKLEAILYASGRPLSYTTIVSHLKLQDEQEAKVLTLKLSEIYSQDGSPLEIKLLPEDRVVLQLKTDYTKEARRFSIKPLLTVGPLRTLSFIAYNQPIEQSEVARVRGSQSYQHIKRLTQMGLIEKEKAGRNKILKTTDEFADTLGLSRERSSMKRQLRSLFHRIETELERTTQPIKSQTKDTL